MVTTKIPDQSTAAEGGLLHIPTYAQQPVGSQRPAPELKPLEGRVFLTGGAGFLGRAIIRRAEREQWPCTFLVYSRDEEKQWKLSQQYGRERVECYLGDVRDYQALQTLMTGCDVAIHTAAVKFIPEAERNAWWCAKVNVDGARNVARAAAWCRVKRTLLISTDKACQPVNVYGMTKALGERLFAEANSWEEHMLFGSVRYGNVVGSTGSIVPVFRDQLARNGRLGITSPEMTRFWMSPEQAVDAVLLALSQMEMFPGAVFVPRVPAMKVIDLARLIAGEAPIDEIGIRPGEKMHETLIHYQEATKTLDRGDYFIVQPAMSAQQSKPMTYSSHSPARWIESQEMAAMIEDARTI